MAHGIMENDTMFSAHGIVPWHGLGTVVQEAPTSEDAIRLAGLDWDVIQEPIYCAGKVVPDCFGNVRSDTLDTVGIITSKYRVVQNRDAFAFVNDIMAQKDVLCRYETAGSLWNGKKVWLLVELPGRFILGDETKNYLWFCNSHDGKSALKAGTSVIRVVCNNTLTAAETHSQRVWSYHHVGNFEARRHEAMVTLGFATTYLDELELHAERMSKIKANVDKFVEKLFPFSDDMSERVKDSTVLLRDTIVEIAKTKDDLQNFRGNAWGIWNAVADHVSNSEPLRRTETAQRTKFISFMDGNALLKKAEGLLLAA